jgi:hypothetical protein
VWLGNLVRLTWWPTGKWSRSSLSRNGHMMGQFWRTRSQCPIKLPAFTLFWAVEDYEHGLIQHIKDLRRLGISSPMKWTCLIHWRGFEWCGCNNTICFI